MARNQPDYAQLLNSCRFSNQKPAEEDFVLHIGEKKIGSLQNLVVVSGLPKAGKSTYMAAMVASNFTPFPIFGIKLTLPTNRNRIGLFDTEQGAYDLWKQRERIRLNAGLQEFPAAIDVFTTRRVEFPSHILGVVEAYLSANPDCSCIFMDGLLDCLLDPIDSEESKLLINWVKRITAQYNVLLITVIHQGKMSGQTLGHVGSNADRAAQAVIEVEKDKQNNVFILQSKYLRSDADFDPIGIYFLEGRYHKAEIVGGGVNK